MSAAPAEIPGDDRFREEQLMAEAEEARDAWLSDWVRRSNDYLWAQCGHLAPWADAGPDNEKTGSEEKAP